jgi:hypothetical protein
MLATNVANTYSEETHASAGFHAPLSAARALSQHRSVSQLERALGQPLDCDSVAADGGVAAPAHIYGTLSPIGWVASAGAVGAPGNPGEGGAGATDALFGLDGLERGSELGGAERPRAAALLLIAAYGLGHASPRSPQLVSFAAVPWACMA